MRKECCQRPGSLEATHPSEDVVIYTCRLCGAKHYRFRAETGKVGLTMKGLGKEKADE